MRTRNMMASAALLCLLAPVTGCAEDASDTAGEPTSSAPTSEEPPGEEPSEPGSETPAEPIVITIEDFEYSDPGPVPAGAEITVENGDDTAHTVTADGKGDFDVTIAPGETATFTAPDRRGTYRYLCTFHSGMTGSLRVA